MQSAAAGYHDGKSRASASPPSGRGGEKEGGQTESAAISDDERKSRGGTCAVPHGRAGSRFPSAINASAKAAKIKRKKELKKWRATLVNRPALGARLCAPARAGILAPSPHFGKFDSLTAKTAGPHTQENFPHAASCKGSFAAAKFPPIFSPTPMI